MKNLQEIKNAYTIEQGFPVGCLHYKKKFVGDCKPNPYQLIWYKQGWSKTRTEKNNAKYWQFEIEHNGLRLP